MTHPPPSSLLAVDAVTLAVAGRTLIRAVSLQVRPGDFWCILGANGVGKTLFLRTLAGLRSIDGGSVTLAGKVLGDWTLQDAARIRGLLPQTTYHAFPMPVIEAVIMGRHPHLSRWAWEQGDDRARAEAALRDVGLAGMAQRDITTLSGGERQRVAIAALLAQEVPLLLLDEPVAHLDLHHQILVLGQLEQLARSGRGVMLSIHDLNLARRFATHALLFGDDASVAVGPAPDVMTEPALSRAYGHPVSRVDIGSRTLFVAD
ncbi:MAG: ABC transporter ATP-binding protein [Betaproteobacteria bacterium]